jgi:FixJ family two-component response regulator
MKAGASDFLMKPVEDATLVAAVRQALESGRAARSARRDAMDARARLASLTRREREVLEGVVAGRLNKQIGADLGITEATVKVHRGRVMEKTGGSSVPDLVRLAELAVLSR